MKQHSPYRQEPIAIIGMAGRFPGANNIESFWDNLSRGLESVTFFSEEELLAAGVEPKYLQDPHYVKARPILPDAEVFDADFFGYTPREAEAMDPQHRHFLQCAWQVLEMAGYLPDGNIGVFGGAGPNSYLLDNYRQQQRFLDSTDSYFRLMLGSEKDYLATRVSYKLNLTGPSFTVQTACSSSLVAVHLACQSLRNQECEMAIAGGVTVRMPQMAGYFFRPGLPLSPDGHCRAFDADAQGTSFGSGVGVVLLKRLADALADRDTIQAVIKGSAVNNDGAIKAGFTAPNINSQVDVIEKALAYAQVDAREISYVEAHGTGTELGDPIEISALGRVFSKVCDDRKTCAIGSVKTNIGHLAAAAGIAGLIKTVLAMQNQQLPPSLHFERPNPRIVFDGTPLFVNTALMPWLAEGDTPLHAGVSSFGFGGTNAHIILQQAGAD